jgi:orotate phosphoribosyltransferase
MSERARLLELFLERSFRVGDFVLASGARSRYYVDCRTTTSHAEGQYLVGRRMLALLDEAGLHPDAVGGLTMGADPVAYAVAHASWLAGRPVHAFAVRKEPKEHGTGRRVEGSFRPGDAVVVLEDVITTGGSARRACDAVRAEGGRVLAVAALIDRGGGGREALEAEGLPVHTVYHVDELLAAAGG